MTVQSVTRYLVVCDCCGKDYGHYESVEEARDFLDDSWAIDGPVVRCDWCNEHDKHDACERDVGHDWDTAGNRHLATFWVDGNDDDPEFQMRRCGICGHAQRRDRGGQWYGYRHGQWLGEQNGGESDG